MTFQKFDPIKNYPTEKYHFPGTFFSNNDFEDSE